MSNFFNNGTKMLKLIVRVRIYINTSRKINVDLKTGFLIIIFWTFIEVRRLHV
jgi:hypothetical protein